MSDVKPYLWLLDSEKKPLVECLDVFDGWADVTYLTPESDMPGWDNPPDAVFFSTEIRGGSNGEFFSSLLRDGGLVPLLAVARHRSLTQALAYLRAGASDYLPLPLEESEVHERLMAALEKAEHLAYSPLTVELETFDQDPGDVSLTVGPRHSATEDIGEDDILAELSQSDPTFSRLSSPESEAVTVQPLEDEPEAVDGLPIPTLWEELPCGLLVFDSLGNLVFSNSLGLDLFGHSSLAELQEALENRHDSFAAHAANHKQLPDNQWPHILARKARATRSAVISVEKPDRRRVWLRIDCQPHLSEGTISRLSMTIVNLTGELPPLNTSEPTEHAPKRGKAKSRSKRKK